MCAAELGGPLSKLFSILFRTGVQPLSWKVANVVPIHKKKSKSALKNYRPVSLLSILSKVMESIVNKSLVNFLETHTVLSRHQFGFRRGLGSSDLLTLLHHQWCRTAGEGGVVRILAADIAGAFDKVSHKGSSTRHPAMASLGNCSPGCKATCRIAASRPLSVGTSLHFIPSPLKSLREAFLAPRCSYSMSMIASTTCRQVLVWLCMQMTLPSITAYQHLHLTPQVCCKLLLMPWPGGEELGRSLLSQRSHR